VTKVDDTRLMAADDRQLLLGELKRNDPVTLREVPRYGSDSFGDPESIVRPRAATRRLVP